MKRDADFFGDNEPQLIYIAKKLRESLALEDVLTKGGIDYLVEPDRYRGGFIFQSERIGAFFYVLPEHVEPARTLMVSHRYKALE
ncbi:MAG: hypothetical protein ABIZ80_09520 [Bryobacteraceae bacterium]